MSSRPIAILMGLFLGLLVTFQNCGVANQIGFENGDASRLASPDANNEGGGDQNTGGGGGGSGSDDGGGGSDPNPGDGDDPLADANFSCDRYVILTHQSPNLLDIPARDASKTCYAVKLLSASSAVVMEGSTKLRDLDVRSARHGSKPDNNPFLIGSFSGEFKAQGQRKLSLSKLPTLGAGFQVDNFVVLEAHYEPGSGIASQYYAAGTRDSLLPATAASGNKPHIMIRNRVTLELEPFTAFVSFADGGVATVATGELSDFVKSESKFTLRLRALDCGLGVRVDDVYAIFR